MKKLFLFISVLFFAVAVNAAIPELTKSASLTLTAATEGFSQSDNAKALVDEEWINWQDGTIQDGYAKWRVNVVNTGVFSVSVDMKSLNTYKYRICVLDPVTNDTLATCFTEKADRHTEEGDEEPKTKIAYENTALPTLEKLDMFAFAAGEYDIIITNVIKWSNGQVRGITLTHEQGDVTTYPNTLIPDNALLSARAWVDKTGTVDSILFTPRGSEGHNLEEWVKWAVEISDAGYYDFTANTYRASSQKFEITLLNQDESETLISNDNGGSSIGSGNASISTGKINLAKGIYVLRVRNIYQYAESRLLNAVVTYKGGKAVDVLGTLSFDDVILSDEAWVDKSGAVDSLLFTARGSEGHNSVNYAKWKVNVATAGAYNFKANVYRPDGSQKYEIKVLSNDENTELASNSLTGLPTGLASINSGNVYLEQGTYTVKVRNTYDYAKSRLLSVVGEYIGGAVQAMPGTTAINEAWFSNEGTREDGKIDFPNSKINEGWVKWNVAFANAGSYKVTVNIDNENGHNYTVALYTSENDNSPISVSEGEQKSTIGTLDLGTMEVPAGNYILKVTNAIQYSDAKLVSVKFSYEGGAVITLPATLPLMEAVLSPLAYKEATTNYIHFTDAEHESQVPNQWAKWNVQAATGLYSFTFNVSSTNYGKYVITIKDDQNNEVYTHEYDREGNGSYTSEYILLTSGDYTVHMQNLQEYSEGYITSISATKDDETFVLDEDATDDGSLAAQDGIKQKLLLKRSFTANKYYTLCIPIDSYESELVGIFGEGYELWKMSSAVQEGEAVSLNFETVEGNNFANSTPYIIKPTQDVVNPTFSKHTFHVENTTKTGAAADFIGTFYKDEIPAGDKNLYLQNNELYYNENNDTPIKGTRAWVRLKTPNAVKARIVMGSQVATGIDLVNGELVDGTVKTIENGQLIIIRDGVRYNVMGAKLQ